MPQKRGIATDQLINVLQVIQLGRKNGLLTVERGEGPQYETGEITFYHGHITSVICGQLEGKKALEWLQTWGPCRFVFVNSTGEPTTGALALRELSPASTTGSLAAIRRDTQNMGRVTPTPRPPSPSGTMHSSGTMYNSGAMNTDQNRTGYPVQSGSGTNYNTPPQTYTPGSLIPQRVCAADEGIKLLSMANLSRQHRQFYLLIDGQRTTFELARLMRRSLDEVLHLLNDLVSIGILRY